MKTPYQDKPIPLIDHGKTTLNYHDIAIDLDNDFNKEVLVNVEK